MERKGVPYNQVTTKAEELTGKVREPRIRAVPNRTHGTGSPNTLLRHLTRWRDARPDVPGTARDLPASILHQINCRIQYAISAGRIEIETQLKLAKTESKDLASTGDSLEVRRDALAVQVVDLTSDIDVLAGRTAEQLAEIKRLAQEKVERERRTVEEALIEVAQSFLKLEEQTGQSNDQQALAATKPELVVVSVSRNGLVELQGSEQSALRARANQSAEAAHVAAGDVAWLQVALAHKSGEGERMRTETLALRDQLSACSVENARLNGSLGPQALAGASVTMQAKKGDCT